MNKKFVVRLSDEERVVCQEIIKHLKGPAQKFRRAQMLLKADADGPGWADVKIAEAFYYLHTQDRSCWTHELQLTPFATKPSF